MTTRQYTYQEVQSANGKDNRTVLAIADKVYDLTDFLNEHPGGEEILLEHGGKDATEDWNDVGHSMDAKELMRKYAVGEITESERRNLPEKPGWKAGYDAEREASVQGPGTPFYAFAAAVVVAVVAYFYLLA